MALQRRLLKDIAELREDPYPNIEFHPRDNDIMKACLILTPHQMDPLHLTVDIGQHYPIQPPQITIQTRVSHPNVFGDFVCASILFANQEWTSAYTMKGICIQLLSFFSSERLEQVDSAEFIELDGCERPTTLDRRYHCPECGFRSNQAEIEGGSSSDPHQPSTPFSVPMSSSNGGAPKSPFRTESVAANIDQNLAAGIRKMDIGMIQDSAPKTVTGGGCNQHSNEMTTLDRILQLPIEIILPILEQLDTRSLVVAARASSEIEQLIISSDSIHLRELQCFCLKESFMKLRLGVGVSASPHLGQTSLGSEFDLLSYEAFQHHEVRRSVHGIYFQHWLPLPLSRRHWQLVKPLVEPSLKALATASRIDHQLSCGYDIDVICSFMTSIVVTLNTAFEKKWINPTSIRSTLSHTSEKAIESYFSLFHLLLCLAVAHPKIVEEANDRVRDFESGLTSKEDCPNIGHLLALTLISDRGLTPSLSLAIIREAVIRNVVWMLDKKGSNMPELCYLEPTPVSEFRMQRTFEGSKTAYRILMFQALFAKIARPSDTTPISRICEEIFERHGAPPFGAARLLARDIRQLRSIDSFPAFFEVMGVDYDAISAEFPGFLKDSIELSEIKGYSKIPIGPDKALGMRLLEEPDVERVEGLVPDHVYAAGRRIGLSFFPGKGKGKEKGKDREE